MTINVCLVVWVPCLTVSENAYFAVDLSQRVQTYHLMKMSPAVLRPQT